MQARTFVIHFHKCRSHEKTLTAWYCSIFDKGTWSIKVTPLIKVIPFHGNKCDKSFLSMLPKNGCLSAHDGLTCFRNSIYFLNKNTIERITNHLRGSSYHIYMLFWYYFWSLCVPITSVDSFQPFSSSTNRYFVWRYPVR